MKKQTEKWYELAAAINAISSTTLQINQELFKIKKDDPDKKYKFLAIKDMMAENDNRRKIFNNNYKNEE